MRELTPIDFHDDGFWHIGRCRNLERLTCMYCRETGDTATEHIKGLGIKYYYAGLTQITDRSLEILGGMESLEQVDLYECLKVTDAGLPFLARLPKLREVHLDGLPGVTLEGTKAVRTGGARLLLDLISRSRLQVSLWACRRPGGRSGAAIEGWLFFNRPRCGDATGSMPPSRSFEVIGAAASSPGDAPRASWPLSDFKSSVPVTGPPDGVVTIR